MYFLIRLVHKKELGLLFHVPKRVHGDFAGVYKNTGMRCLISLVPGEIVSLMLKKHCTRDFAQLQSVEAVQS